MSLLERVERFVEDVCIPAEEVFDAQLASQRSRWGAVPPVMEDVKAAAKKAGLWNLWLTKDYDAEVPRGAAGGQGLTLQQYAEVCEVLGRSPRIAPEATNSSAPDTGNMEVLLKYGSSEQKDRWLRPLLDGSIRSAFLMTEPEVASSDARNIETSICRDGDTYVVNGRKWWSSGAMDPRCAVTVVMGKTDAGADAYHQQSMILVPMDTPGVRVVRPLTVFGYDDAPHGHAEVVLDNVRVPAGNLLLGEGRGFEIAQGRLGPGRIHHCMRAIGIGERAMQLILHRITSRKAFGRELARISTVQTQVAEARVALEACRALVLRAAALVDAVGGRAARKHVAIIKVFVPRAICDVLDTAIQLHGAKGVCGDTILPGLMAAMRTLRIADGPDAVHLQTIAKLELGQWLAARRSKL